MIYKIKPEFCSVCGKALVEKTYTQYSPFDIFTGKKDSYEIKVLICPTLKDIEKYAHLGSVTYRSASNLEGHDWYNYEPKKTFTKEHWTLTGRREITEERPECWSRHYPY